MGGGGRGGQLQPVRQALAATLVTVGQLAQGCGDRAQNAEAPAVQPRHLPNAARAAEQFIAAESREGHIDALSSRQVL